MSITAMSLFLEELELWFGRCRTPKSSTQVMAQFGTSYPQTLAALRELVEQGVLVRTGLKRSTRYQHHSKAGAGIPQPLSGRWHERVRDVAVELGTFTLADAHARLPDLAPGTVRRWLARLVKDGVLSVERVDGAFVYGYIPPPTQRPAASATASDRLAPTGGFAGPTAVAGTGQRGQPARQEVRDLLAQQRARGREVVEQKHGYAVMEGGRVIATVPRTASDHRSLRNLRADLERHERKAGDKP